MEEKKYHFSFFLNTAFRYETCKFIARPEMILLGVCMFALFVAVFAEIADHNFQYRLLIEFFLLVILVCIAFSWMVALWREQVRHYGLTQIDRFFFF